MRGSSAAKGYLALTGTPGTGKKTIAPILAKITGLRRVDLNEFARKVGATTRGKEAEMVDTQVVRGMLRRMEEPPVIVHGHLVPWCVPKATGTFVAVLRCEPRMLKARLQARGYPGWKVRENVEAELIGVLLADSLGVYGESSVHEYDTTQSRPTRVARRIALDYYLGDKTLARDRIDWTTRYDTAEKLRSLLGAAEE
jgi:adenylate kinase